MTRYKPNLVKATIWAKQTFESGSRPGRDTVIDWIRTGEVPGRLIGGQPYVDADRFVLNQPTPQPDKKPLTGLDLLR